MKRRHHSMAITQQVVANALGLSNFQVNRTLQELRQANLIKLVDAKLQVLNWNGLKDAGQFDPRYLHLRTRRGRVVRGSPPPLAREPSIQFAVTLPKPSLPMSRHFCA
jgi:hypothetical protein